MIRASLASLRTPLGLALPTVILLGCPGDDTPATDETSSTGDAADTSSTGDPTADPDTSITIDPTTETTIDPDSSSTADESSSSSGPGFEGCGDGDVDAASGEMCDGDNLDGRTCATQDFVDGVLACNADCTLDTSGCNYACGDGDVQGDEQCEGNDLDGQTCATQGFDGGNLDCNVDCTFDVSGCEDYVCGDGLQAGPEACDGEDLDGETCQSQGFDSGALACAADCGTFDTSGCFVCGDGVINGDEQCDGAALDGETCISRGLEGGVLGCTADCTFDTAECVGCGNGDQDPGEECDTNDFGANSCVGLGYEGGSLTCSQACEIVDVSCFGPHTFCADPAAAIGPGAGTLTQSTIAVAGLAGIVADVDVIVDATHTAVGDLDIDVRHVDSNLSVSLVDDLCGTNDDIDATFDQDAANPPACAGSPTISGNVLPQGNLDSYVGAGGNGSWELSILDQTAGNGGALAQWCVTITTESDGGSLVTVRPDDDMVRAINPLTLEFTDIGPLGVDFDFGEVAYDENTGTLWMIDGWASRSLYTVDLTTGAATLVGPHLVNDLFGLAHDTSTGILYGSSPGPGGLYSMDQTTGLATFLNDAGGFGADGLAYDGVRNQLVGLWGGPGTMFTVDPDDGTTVILSDEGFINNCGLAYEPEGDLYWAIDWSGDLYTYDPNAAYTRTFVLNAGAAHDGLTFVPGLEF